MASNQLQNTQIKELQKQRYEQIKRSVSKRQKQEKCFHGAGVLALLIAIACVVILFANILSKGIPGFMQVSFELPVYYDPAVINVGPKPIINSGEKPFEFKKRLQAWDSELAMVNWNQIILVSLSKLDPDKTLSTNELLKLVTSAERFNLKDKILKDPSLVGQTKDHRFLADANVDVWVKGNIDRNLPDNRQQLSKGQRNLVDKLAEQNVLQNHFSTALLFNADSRNSPASAGIAGAFVGTLYMMIIVAVLAVPVGIASAIYLEEFAPKNLFIDLVEVNINNLAAVPSIVFGLLGAAIFINFFHLPMSAPLVGGLVLSLMTLPTVIITTRNSLKAVPGSIRQAAYGLGASKVQTVFHHILPLGLPGILTGAIIGLAQAIGETAPLLLIGMTAFVATIPGSPMDQSAALPVEIYLWQGNEMRNFFEPRTAAAIVVLLLLMLLLNAIAIWLRKKLETRW